MLDQHIEILKDLKNKESKASKPDFQKEIEAHTDMNYAYLLKIGGMIHIGMVGEGMMTISFVPHGSKEEIYSYTSQRTFMYGLMKLRAHIDKDDDLAEAADLLYPYPPSVGGRNAFDHMFRQSRIVTIGAYCHEIRACMLSTELPSTKSLVCPYIYLATGHSVCEALLNVDRARPQPMPFDPMYLMGNPSN